MILIMHISHYYRVGGPHNTARRSSVLGSRGHVLRIVYTQGIVLKRNPRNTLDGHNVHDPIPKS